MESRRYNVIKLEELIRNYVNSKGRSSARIELADSIIDGEDFIDVLDNLEFEPDKEIDEYKQVKEDYEDLVENHKELEKKFEELTKRYKNLEEEYNKNIKADIEKLIQGKEGSFVDKIRKILKG
jgi:predicted RNase H-like nuclease (RuvC/YqgF family)